MLLRPTRVLAYVIVLSVALGVLATVASADNVSCRPIIRHGRVVALCFTVCNVSQTPCEPQEGCIWDVHFRFAAGTPCQFTGTLSIPRAWAVTTPYPSPGVSAVTPAPGSATLNPIAPNTCYRFCFRIDPACSSQYECLRVIWRTTDRAGRTRDRGGTRCCWPTLAAE